MARKDDLSVIPAVAPLSQCPEWQRLNARLDELRRRQSDAEARADQADDEAAAAARGHVNADLLHAPELPDRITGDVTSLRAQAKDLRREADACRRAIEAGEAQLPSIAKKWSAEVTREL